MPVEPFTAVAAGLNISLKILEVSFQLNAVGEQTKDFLNMTAHVDRNVSEARRLRRYKDAFVRADERAWMDEQINDCERALQEVQQLLEPARVNAAITHSINPKNRALWVFKDGPRVRDKRERLSACHQTLNTVITVLSGRTVVVATSLPTDNFPEPPPPYAKDMEAMFNWRMERRNRQSIVAIKSSDAYSLPTSSFCDPSISNPSTTVPPSPDALLSSPKEARSPLVSCISDEMSAKAAPSSFYCSYDGQDGLQVSDTSGYSCDGQDGLQVFHASSYSCDGQDGLQIYDTTSCSFRGDDGLQVFDTSSQSQIARDALSPIMSPGGAENVPFSLSSPYTSGPTNPTNFLGEHGHAHDQDYTTSLPLTTNVESPIEEPRLFSGMRGRDWLASYAAGSDTGLSYGFSQGHR